MKTYFANFYANNGTRFLKPITGTNKNKLIQAIRNTALAERFIGNQATWEVWTMGEYGLEITIAQGYIDDYGYHRLK